MDKRIILQGEVYVCELDGIDSEQRGEKLCIVLQLHIINKTSPNVIIVPITSKHKKDMPTHLTFTQEEYSFFRYKENTALCECIRSVSKSRLGKRVGKIEDEDLGKLLIIKEYAYKIKKINKY